MHKTDVVTLRGLLPSVPRPSRLPIDWGTFFSLPIPWPCHSTPLALGEKPTDRTLACPIWPEHSGLVIEHMPIAAHRPEVLVFLVWAAPFSCHLRSVSPHYALRHTRHIQRADPSPQPLQARDEPLAVPTILPKRGYHIRAVLVTFPGELAQHCSMRHGESSLQGTGHRDAAVVGGGGRCAPHDRS